MAGYYVQGKLATLPEFNVAQALARLDKPFVFQYLIGNRRLRGSVAIDFVIEDPFVRGLEVYGEYWHKGQLTPQERFRLETITSFLGRPPMIIWARFLQRYEDTYKHLRTLLGRVV